VSEADYPAQRRARRLQTSAVRVHLSPGTVINLSEVGALLELPVRVELGSTLSFRLECDGTVATLHGRVMWSQPPRDLHARVEWRESDRYQVGVEFIDVSDQSRTTLREVLRKAGER
jgi:hypothetical protein